MTVLKTFKYGGIHSNVWTYFPLPSELYSQKHRVMVDLLSDPKVIITIVCSIFWIISTIVHFHTFFTRSKEGLIRLSEDDDEDEAAAAFQEQDGLSPEEIEAIKFTQADLDGIPVDVEKYKKSVRHSRLYITFFSAISLCLLGVQLALQGKNPTKPHHPISWSNALRNPTCWPILASILLWLNIFYFALQGMRKRTYWPAVVQIASLSFTALVASISVLVIPGTTTDDQLVYYGLQAITSFVVVCIAVFTPSGPRHVKQTPQGPRSMARISHKGRTIFSQLWFTNPYEIIRIVRKNGTIEENDCPLLGSDFDAHLVHLDFKREYKKATKARQQALQKNPSLDKKKRMFAIVHDCWPITRALVNANLSLIVKHTLMCFVAAFWWYVPAYVSFQIVQYLETTEKEQEGKTPISGPERLRFGFRFCLLLSGTIMLQSLLTAQLFTTNMVWLKNRTKTQLQMAIFSKALRRKDVESIEEFKKKENANQGEDEGDKDDKNEAEEEDESASGSFSKAQVINLVSADTERISNMLYLFTLANAPIEIMVGGFFAIYLLGWAAVIGLASSFLFQPVLYFVGKALVKLEDKHQKVRDKRTSLLNETVQAIRMIKFNAWEEKASARIQVLRDEELYYQKWIYYVQMMQTYLLSACPHLTILISYAWYIFVEKKPLIPSVGFTSLAVLEEMRFALTYIPEAVSQVIQSLVSLRRVQLYLDSDEIELPERSTLPASHKDLSIVNGTISWPKEKDKGRSTSEEGDSQTFTLNDINVRFTPNALNLIVGRLGSGKTLLLKGLLGEADVLTGNIYCPRSLPNSIRRDAKISKASWMRSDQIAYLPQTSFLVNASLRDNILFGLPMLEERYQATLDACGLRPDMKLLTDGDETEIGENGIGLSGGQMNRVMLARAVYSRANTLILDDPLSAVDAHTAAHIHTNLLRGPLCADRTVILVTHQVQLVAQSAAKIVMLNDGKLEFDGDSMTFLKSDLYSGLIEELEQEQKEKEKDVEKDDQITDSSAGTSTLTTPATTAPPSPALKAQNIDQTVDEPVKKTPKKLVEDEKRAKGAVLLSIYARFIKSAGGLPVVMAVVVTLIVSNCMVLVSTKWVQYWTEDVANGLREGGIRNHSDFWWLCCLGAIWFVEINLQVLQMYTLVFASLRASRSLFTDMLRSVVRAPLRFHDTVSRGRLLNRFGYDFQEMDSEVVDALERTGDQLVTICVTMGAIATGGGIPFAIFFAMMIPLYVIVGQVYLLAVRDMKRLSSTTRSPILNTFGDVIRGTVVVRAFGGSDYFYKSLVEKLNDNTLYIFWMSELRYWYEQLFDTFSFFVLLVAVVFVLLNPEIKSGQAGFVLTFVINGHIHLLFFLRALTDMEQKLVSVERIVEYAQLDSEKGVETGPNNEVQKPINLPVNWPEQGQVSVENLHVRYASDLPEVLHGVSFEIQPSKKVGVVGSTGCGKSTLASSFFRFVEKTEGSIKIDGIDIGQVDLNDLRSRLQIVPQDPIIFSGPLRGSLDVFDEYTDEQIFEALRKVQLIQQSEGETLVDVENPNVVKKRDFSDLNFMVSDGGSNLSNGEKQLLCLARAILRNCKIIIFDEATSSVDFDTDAIISQTIRQAFEQSTIITIAHRLRTIIDYDYVLVMDKGNAVEFAKPTELLRDPTTRFYKLCRASGKRELAHLKEAAGVE